MTPVGEVGAAGEVTVRGRLADLKAVRVRRRGLALVRGAVEDDTGRLAVVWFNRPYLAHLGRLGRGVPAARAGAARRRAARWRCSTPPASAPPRRSTAGGSRRSTRRCAGVGPAALRRLLPQLLAALDLPRARRPAAARPPRPPRPAAARRGARRAPRAAGGRRPRRRSTAAAAPRICGSIYGELLELQLELALLRERAVREPRRHHYRIDDGLRADARARSLPFPLTAAQKRVLREIAADLPVALPDAPPAPGRRRQRQDDRRRPGAADRARERLPGGLHGADRAARRAALRRAWRACSGSAAASGSSPARDRDAGALREALAAGDARARGRHPRADPGGRRVPAARPLRRSTSSTASASCSASSWRARAERPGRAGDDRDADPALARPRRLRRPRAVGPRRAAAGADAGRHRGRAGQARRARSTAPARGAGGGRPRLRGLPARSRRASRIAAAAARRRWRSACASFLADWPSAVLHGRMPPAERERGDARLRRAARCGCWWPRR